LLGIVTAFAAVGFHEVINFIRDLLYLHVHPTFLYGRGLFLLILFPAAGGLAVGLISRYILGGAEGHGIVDVMESVVLTRGFQRPSVAVEKILTSGLTIGSGGSAGAEGPIVQIGAALASGVGQVFGLARQKMPLLTGCGCAAGISAIFNAPFGGVLFTLEVILQDFSLRAFTPIVVSSVIAQVTTLAIFGHTHQQYQAIFAMPPQEIGLLDVLSWAQVANFVLLGLLCGVAGLGLTRMMDISEKIFHGWKIPRPLLPAAGGALLGVTGILYVLLAGRVMLGRIKPFEYSSYPPPAFFGDGYGVVQQLLVSGFPGYVSFSGKVLALLVILCVVKIIATCLTLSSGGSGGVIAPSLFIGATAGGALGIILKQTAYFHALQPELYALVGMGAVLAAVVHAPLASILIVFELTQDYKVMLPAMLACVVATSVARVLYPDSIYTLGLRRRGLRAGCVAEQSVLSRLTIEQAPLEAAPLVRASDGIEKILKLSAETGAMDFVVSGENGKSVGFITSADFHAALLERDAIPLLTCGDLARADLPIISTQDSLAAALEVFAECNAERLPVVVGKSHDRVVGMISRAALMRRYQQELLNS
jgi:CIC family chloride channel protein